jgi:hypothetical protein
MGIQWWNESSAAINELGDEFTSNHLISSSLEKEFNILILFVVT